MKENYLLISNTCVEVQKILNEKAKIGLKAQKPKLNQDRIDGVINKVANVEKYSDVAWMLDEPIVNFSQSIVDDSVKTNASFHYKSGLSPKIVRTSTGRCCDWCNNVVGVYAYPNVPHDVYRRHNYCRCTVTYNPSDGSKKVQDVWSKKWQNQSKFDIVQSRLKMAEQKKHLGVDVTKLYLASATPKKGKIKFDKNYKLSKHAQEKEIADFILKHFGGDILLLTESETTSTMTADYLWDGKLWDLKTVTTEKSADSAIRKGVKQIYDNAGGIILDYRNKSISLSKVLDVIDNRMKRVKNNSIDIMIIISDKSFKIYRYKK